MSRTSRVLYSPAIDSQFWMHSSRFAHSITLPTAYLCCLIRSNVRQTGQRCAAVKVKSSVTSAQMLPRCDDVRGLIAFCGRRSSAMFSATRAHHSYGFYTAEIYTKRRTCRRLRKLEREQHATKKRVYYYLFPTDECRLTDFSTFEFQTYVSRADKELNFDNGRAPPAYERAFFYRPRSKS